MCRYELRIRSDLLQRALTTSLDGRASTTVLEVERHRSEGGRVEFIAQGLVDDKAPRRGTRFALVYADSAIRAFIHALPSIVHGGFAGAIFLPAAGLSADQAIGVVCANGGIDWLHEVIEVAAGGAIFVRRWPLNSRSGAMPDGAPPPRLVLLGSAPLTAALAAAPAGLSATGWPLRDAASVLAEADVLVVHPDEHERHALPALAALCERRLRVLLVLHTWGVGVGGGAAESGDVPEGDEDERGDPRTQAAPALAARCTGGQRGRWVPGEAQ